MIGTIALIAAILFVAVALGRLVPALPAALGMIALAAALVAGLCGFAHWHAGGDSRWAVGATLLLGALPASYLGARNRRLLIVAAVLGVLGAVLFGIALSTRG